MLIHSIDGGRRSGWAIGPAGQVPNQGYLILRKEKEPRAKGTGNLIAYLDQMWRRRKPDLLVYEAPMNVGAWGANILKRQRLTSGDDIESGLEMQGVIQGMAERFGVRCEPITRTTIMWKITGKGSWGDEGDKPDVKRKKGKAAVMRALRTMGMIPDDCVDEDRADAVAMHVYASGKFAKNQNSNFGLFAKSEG